MKIGYARVSTQDQNLDRQLDNLKEQAVERIYTEKMTGTKTHRPEFDRMMDVLRPGDTLVVDSFSRLSRSTKDLLDITEQLQQKKVELVSLKEKLDTTTATGKMMMTMLSALSQFERDLISERTRDGLKAARARGHKGGRKPVDQRKVEQALKMYEGGTMTVKEISEATGISVATINRRIAAFKHHD